MGLDLTGWTLASAGSVSDDGLTIAGIGVTRQAEVHAIGRRRRVVNNTEVAVTAGQVKFFNVQAVVEMSATDEIFGHDIGQTLALAEVRVDDIVKHTHVDNFHRPLGCFANCLVALV